LLLLYKSSGDEIERKETQQGILLLSTVHKYTLSCHIVSSQVEEAVLFLTQLSYIMQKCSMLVRCSAILKLISACLKKKHFHMNMNTQGTFHNSHSQCDAK